MTSRVRKRGPAEERDSLGRPIIYVDGEPPRMPGSAAPLQPSRTEAADPWLAVVWAGMPPDDLLTWADIRDRLMIVWPLLSRTDWQRTQGRQAGDLAGLADALAHLKKFHDAARQLTPFAAALMGLLSPVARAVAAGDLGDRPRRAFLLDARRRLTQLAGGSEAVADYQLDQIGQLLGVNVDEIIRDRSDRRRDRRAEKQRRDGALDGLDPAERARYDELLTSDPRDARRFLALAPSARREEMAWAAREKLGGG